MHEADQLVVKIIGRTTRDAPDDTGDDPVSDLANQEEDCRNDGSLQIDIWPNQLGELLYPGNRVSQSGVSLDQ